jgi:hypothetical protein
MGDQKLPADRMLPLLSAIVDCLLPGGEGFPSATAAGVPSFMLRLLEHEEGGEMAGGRYRAIESVGG